MLILISCKENKSKEEEVKIISSINWYSAMSSPANYRIDGPHIYYYSKGKLINSDETLTTIGNFGWVYPNQGRSSSLENGYPDSVYVKYGGLNEKLQTCWFEGGNKLPYNKIKRLFENGYKVDNKKVEFQYITTGMAPGGRVCIWLDHIEILRFKIKIQEIYNQKPFDYTTEVNSVKQVLSYLKHHPVDYSIWEKPDPRYELDFGFCSEDKSITYWGIYIISKEGIRDVITRNRIDKTIWKIPYGEKPDIPFTNNYQQINETIRDYKICLPVDVQISWKINEVKRIETNIVMPKNLPQRFTKSYINPETNKPSYFNRIVFGVEKDGTHCIMWLDGPGKQEKIMRFKGLPGIINKDKSSETGGYATEVVYY